MTLGASGTGALFFSGTTTIAGPTTLTTLGAGIVFSGKFTGNNAFSKGGAANLFLNGTTNDYGGAFTLTAGNLLIADFNLGTPNQLGTAASLTLSGGVCFINGNTAYSSFATPISGTADVYVTNTSSGGVTFTGSALSSYNGSLRLYTDSAYGSATVQKITTTALASSNFFFLTGGGLSSQVSQTLVYNGTSALAYGNAILILPQSGPGITAKIENASSNNTAISFSGTLSNNGTSAYATSIEFATTNANITHSGNITEASTGTLNLSKTGSNALTLSGSTSTYKGTVSVSAGTLNANSATALGAASSTAGISVTSGATLSLGAALSYSSPGRTTSISGTGVGGTAGALVIARTGDVNVGSISLTGPTTIRGTVTGGRLTSSITGTQNLALNIDTSVTTTLAGAISTSAGSLTKSGSGTLSLTNGTNAYSGGTTISAGTLSFSSGALGSSGSVSVSSAALQWLNANTQDLSARLVMPSIGGYSEIDVGANNVSFASAIGNSGSAALYKSGTGALTLTQASTYTGLTTIAAGTLRAGTANALASSSQVAIGANTATLQTLTTGGQNGKLTVASLNNAAGGTIKIGG